MADDVDAEFNTWFNTHQPLRKILTPADAEKMPGMLVRLISREIKQAFTHGYARGVASEVARFPPEHPELGNVR